MLVSLFDVAGPIMVGPSSSHTAGACKIGQIVRAIEIIPELLGQLSLSKLELLPDFFDLFCG